MNFWDFAKWRAGFGANPWDIAREADRMERGTNMATELLEKGGPPADTGQMAPGPGGILELAPLPELKPSIAEQYYANKMQQDPRTQEPVTPWRQKAREKYRSKLASLLGF